MLDGRAAVAGFGRTPRKEGSMGGKAILTGSKLEECLT